MSEEKAEYSVDIDAGTNKLIDDLPNVQVAIETLTAAYMTVSEAAAQLGLYLPTVYDAVRNGRIESREIFGQTVVRRSSVAAYRGRKKKARTANSPGESVNAEQLP